MFDDLDLDLEEMDEAEESAMQEATEGLLPPRQMHDWLGDPEMEQRLLGLMQSGRMPHALIFAGPQGIGKATMAFRFARFLLKHGVLATEENEGPGLFGEEEAPVVLPANMSVDLHDPVFRQVASGGHPDLLTIERPFDEKRNRFKGELPVDEVRKVPGFLRLKASRGGWRVVIVDDADTMNANAQNAILKILEEPPEQALLILIAHRPGALIPTIRSRCRVIPFQPMDIDQITHLLRREHPALSQDETALLYGLSEGRGGKALQVLDEGGLEMIASVLDLLGGWPNWDWPAIHMTADRLSASGQDNALQAFEDVMLWITGKMLKSMATGEPLPQALDQDVLKRMLEYYTLEQWVKICDNLGAHFTTVHASHLDKKHAVFGAFSLFES